ncbi:MAG: DnaA N-terminal domain-containing protein, partial [Burkholderiales bacterium]|nr:DnaA N-terminal domain-containing protein [Burkholderiales bacterium]
MNSFWDGCLEYFKTVLSSQQYKTWVHPLDGAIINGEIVIVAPNRFLLVWARDNYSKDLKRLAKESGGSQLPIRFTLKTPSPTDQIVSEPEATELPTNTSEPIDSKVAKKNNRLPQLNP